MKFYSNLTEVCSQGSNKQYSSIGSDNGCFPIEKGLYWTVLVHNNFCPGTGQQWQRLIDAECGHLSASEQIMKDRDQFVYVPSQWDKTLDCNIISHWLGTYTKWSLKEYDSHYIFLQGSVGLTSCVPKLSLKHLLTWNKNKQTISHDYISICWITIKKKKQIFILYLFPMVKHSGFLEFTSDENKNTSTIYTYSISYLLMAWQNRAPGHLHLWPSLLAIIHTFHDTWEFMYQWNNLVVHSTSEFFFHQI